MKFLGYNQFLNEMNKHYKYMLFNELKDYFTISFEC